MSENTELALKELNDKIKNFENITVNNRKLLYKTLKHEKSYDVELNSLCLFSYYTTEEIRMNVYITILDSSFNIKNISFYLYDYPGNEGKLIGNVIHKIYRSDINATYDLYKDSVNSNIKSLYINYDTIKKITVCLEILSGNIYELNFGRSSDKEYDLECKKSSSDNPYKMFFNQGLFKTDAINKTMLNVNIKSDSEPWHNDDIYNTNMMFTYNPFQIHNEYASDFNGIRFGSGSEKTGTVENGNSYINIYTGDDKDPIYVTQYTHNGEEKYEKKNQITLLDEEGHTLLGDTIFFDSNESSKKIVISKGDTDMAYDITGIYIIDENDMVISSMKSDGYIESKNISASESIFAIDKISTYGTINIGDYDTNRQEITISAKPEDDVAIICVRSYDKKTDIVPGELKIYNSNSDPIIYLNANDGSVKATSFNASSDKRLKKNIVDYTPQKSILDLPIKEFDYITTEKHAIGCLAQDLQEICPEIVDTDEKGYLSIQESKIVYLLLDEVKKLRKELDELKGRE